MGSVLSYPSEEFSSGSALDVFGTSEGLIASFIVSRFFAARPRWVPPILKLEAFTPPPPFESL